ncbi:hypothetical protein AAG906_003477 [Vitis piasezkii]
MGSSTSAATGLCPMPDYYPVASTAKQLTSPELVALEYADLNLNYDNVSQEVGHVRIRQHVNPFAPSFSIPAPVPNWSQAFKDSTLPLMVDIGSGSGRFLMWLAKRNPDSQNYLGLEIRQKLAKRAEFWVKELSLHNIHFMFANATISFKELVSATQGPDVGFNTGELEQSIKQVMAHIHMQCPDPHFKKRHHKRRVVQKPLVDSIVKNLMPGGQVFIQSDVLEVAVDMRDRLDAESDLLQHIDTIDPSMQCDEEGWESPRKLVNQKKFCTRLAIQTSKMNEDETDVQELNYDHGMTGICCWTLPSPHGAYHSQGYPPSAYPPPGGYPPSGYPPPVDTHHLDILLRRIPTSGISSSRWIPPAPYPPPGGYPPSGYPGPSAPPYHSGHGSNTGALLAGGAAAAAAVYGAHQLSHGAHHLGHGGYYGHGFGHHGKFKHGKFKHGKFGKRWKHGMYGKHKGFLQEMEMIHPGP